ncbi:MAG TPA: 2-oxoglutarate and iron-dependent oxygenase domain-containing protein [Candidatus Lustribacter sp.]|nr:2-oxoglutarate and iron-dependent oxygenase domain-containing protein [Candidatus Lustribacter sp.]
MAIPASRRLDFSEIPIIDAARLIGGHPDPQTVAALDRACTDVGFFYVTNHGVAPRLIADVAAQAARFFALPMDEKLALTVNPRMRGYLPLNYESLVGEPGGGVSQQEGFWIGHERPVATANPLDGPNVWPASVPELAPAMSAYLTAVETLSAALLRAFALALGFRRDHFVAVFTAPQSRLKLNHYPPQDAPQHESDIGVVGHSDSGGFTIMWQDANGGLEVQAKNGEWVGAPPVADTFVINIGTVLQIWTDGRFSSTPHRVINRSGSDRYSVPLFVNPNYDAPVAGQRFADYQTEIWRRIFPVAFVPA